MPRLSVSDLVEPSDPYRVDKIPEARFETLAMAAAEDLIRAARLRAPLIPGKYKAEALELAGKLAGRDISDTLASKRFMMEARRRLSGAVLELVIAAGAHVSFVTAISSDWSYSAKELLQVDPKRLTAQLRSALYRCGGRDADGWLIAFIDIDFDPDTKRFQLHFHGFAAGETREVLRRVRRNPKFRSWRPGGRKQGLVYQKIQLTTKPLTNLPYLVTYPFKSVWSLTRVGFNGELGGQRAVDNEANPQSPRCTRHRMPGRIPEPYHSAILLWLNRQRLQDITLLVKLSVSKTGLTLTKPAKPRKRKR